LPGSGLAATALAAAGNGELAQNVVLHERKKLVDALVLVMVRIDIDDQDIIELALLRLFPGMSEQAAGIQLFDGNAAAAIGNQVHGVSSGCGSAPGGRA
jgi:hypothetical protein